MIAISSATRRTHNVLMTIAFTLLLYLFVVYVVYAINLMSFPFDYDQGEGFELVDTILFSQGQFPYRDTEIYPFYSSNYPPLFHLMTAPFVWIFGEAYWYGRLLSFLGTLVTASAIAYAVNREGRHRWIAALSGLAFLASNFIYHIGPLVRQHMTMVMFETLAVIILAYAFPAKQTRRIAIGLLLIIAAGYTKQLAAITAIAVLIWMIMRNPRRGILWGILFAFVGSTIFVWLNIVTGGQWWLQTVVANVNQFRPFQAINLFILFFQLHGFLLIPALLYAIYELYFDRISLYSLWFVFALVLGGIGSGTWGAGDSYFATAIAGMCILSGLFASRILRQNWQFRDHYVGRLIRLFTPLWTRHNFLVIVIMIPLLYIGYGRAVFHMPIQGIVFEQVAVVLGIEPNIRNSFFDSASFDVEGYANIGYLVTQEDIDAGYRIVAMIEETDAPVMSEEAGFSLVAGREVVTNPTQLLNLAKAKQFEGTVLIQMIEQQQFGMIIHRAQFYPTSVLEAIGQAYALDEVVEMNGFEYLIKRPIGEETD